MATKSLGCCPYCKETVTPTVLEENTIRRDICQCPQCEGQILICRTPGCDDYAKSGDVYDDELCPSCTAKVTSTAGQVVEVAVLAVATAAAGAVVTAVTAAAAKK